MNKAQQWQQGLQQEFGNVLSGDWFYISPRKFMERQVSGHTVTFRLEVLLQCLLLRWRGCLHFLQHDIAYVSCGHGLHTALRCMPGILQV